MDKMITVGISDLNVARSPEILVTYALGSCVGICLYDSAVRIAGLSHIMLPSSEMARTNQPSRFADTAIVELVRRMEIAGARQARMRAKIAGGAQMFAAMNNTMIANIGQRNVIAVRAELARLRIPILADDTGSDYGRTVFFSAEDGMMRIKAAAKGEKLL